MFIGLAGLTAIEVSLCGPTDGSVQSVLTLAAVEVAVVQMAVPVLTDGAVPNTAPGTGAGAFTTLCVKSRGCGLSSAAAASVCPSATAAIGNKITKRSRLKSQPSSASRRPHQTWRSNATKRLCHRGSETASFELQRDVFECEDSGEAVKSMADCASKRSRA